MKKTKKKINAIKIVSFIAGAIAAAAAIVAILMLIKKKAEAEKKREAEIETEITEIIEKKFAEAAAEDAEERAGEE